MQMWEMRVLCTGLVGENRKEQWRRDDSGVARRVGGGKVADEQ